MPYVDVHTHLTHEKFKTDLESVINNATKSGLEAIVCNGLEPVSNRIILEMSKKHPIVKPALGIYPLDAACKVLPSDLPFEVTEFDVDKEVDFIAEQARLGNLVAIGECGLDGYWIKDPTFPEQERVFERLIEVAVNQDIPIIIHNRKLELRSMEILRNQNVKRVNFHCFGGKVKLALKAAEEEDWCFSIPANARKNEAFTQMLQKLPESKILTETDAPYLPPIKGERNEPANVVGTIEYLAELKNWNIEKARDLVWENYQRLFQLTAV